MIKWKSALLLGVLTAVVGIVSSLSSSSSYAQAQTLQSPDEWTTHTYIAHALGGVGNDIHINSVDAFNLSYQKGFKVFETDLTLTSDDKLVANHDWSGYQTPPTYAEFMKNKVYGKYTPTDAQEILDLLEKHPDMYLVTDTKETDPVLIRKQFTKIVEIAKQIDPSILDRIIPEIYTPQMYNVVNSIYPFKNKYYSIYLLGDTPKDRQDIINFMLQHDIQTLTMPVERLDSNFMKLIKENHLTLYVFTVNSTQDVAKLKQMGVHGVYTDTLTPDDPISTQTIAQTETSNQTPVASSKNKIALILHDKLSSLIQTLHEKFTEV
jgi:glycerophosphoryl diester phosphodiesterase